MLQGLGSIPGVKVLYSPGLPSLDDLFSQSHFASAPGTANESTGVVKIETFLNRDFFGRPSIAYADTIATWKPLAWSEDAGIKKSIRYSTVFTPTVDGDHIVIVAATASDGYELRIDGKRAIQ
jgi:hypothetical protein